MKRKKTFRYQRTSGVLGVGEASALTSSPESHVFDLLTEDRMTLDEFFLPFKQNEQRGRRLLRHYLEKNIVAFEQAGHELSKREAEALLRRPDFWTSRDLTFVMTAYANQMLTTGKGDELLA